MFMDGELLGDAKPAIPSTQSFYLTTQSKAVPPPPETSIPDGQAAGSYFDKPEVKAAYLAQRAIQVPEFAPLPNDAVGGRLRARAEEEGPETSDDAYLTRHRKYETFEKRQRRREKEKLIHEQYKLKERIEQLKGMDASAFGGGGETRRREMLDVAESLEMRYAVLLPPEPKRGPKKNENKRRNLDDARAGTTTGDDGDGDTDEEVAENSEMENTPTIIRPHKTSKANVRLPSQTPVVSRTRAVSNTPVVSRTPAVSVALASSVPQHKHIAPVSTSPSPRSNARVRDFSGRLLPLAKPEETHTPPTIHFSPEPITATQDILEAPPPRKRPRIDLHIKRMQTPEDNPIASSVLLQIAARKAAQPQARQTTRTTLAFGFRVPPDVEDLAYYELPGWLITQEELEHLHEMRTRSATRSASLNPAEHAPNGVDMPKDNAADIPVRVNGFQPRDERHIPTLPTSSVRDEDEPSN